MDPRALIAADAPPRLTREEQLFFLVATVAVAASRLLAVSRTLWDWDEALFALALRSYDVAAHHPQPPGFPLFIGLASLLPFDGFHSLQLLAVCSALAVFPLTFALARELGASFFAALAAALLLAFFPNVWFFGGTAFSDVPSMVLSLGASLLLLRGRRSDPTLIAGALLLAVAAGFRPQNLLIGFVPAILALMRRPRAALLGAAGGIAILAASYGSAAMLSGGWEVYRQALASHEQYIRATDSFLSATRPDLIQVADDFFLRPWRAPILNIAVTLLAVAGAATRRRSVLLAFAIFGPFTIFAWLFLDFHSASRFSIAYMPLVAIAAAEGIALAGRAKGALLALVTAMLFVWSLPPLRIARTTDSPPVAAIEAIRSMDPATTIVWVDERLAAHAALLLPEYERRTAKAAAPVVSESRAGGLLLREGASNAPGARTFARTDERLSGIVRPRYLATSLLPVKRFEFASGWYAEEGTPRNPWRWMRDEGTIVLPPESAGGTLTLRGSSPAATRLTLTLDGAVVDRCDVPPGPIEKEWRIGRGQTLVLKTDAAVVPENDARRLGLRVDSLELVR